MAWTMLGNGIRSSILSLWLYFILNMLVTFTNKQIVSRTACPWLLTGSHAFTTFLTTGVISRLQRPGLISTTTGTSTVNRHCLADDRRLDENDDDDGTAHNYRDRDWTRPSLRIHLRILLPFSLLYTLNIALSNLALGLVTLTMHQTIRATAPVITVLISIAWLGRSWREYHVGVYGAIGLTICGVIIATNAASSPAIGGRSLVGGPTRTTAFGFTVTLLGAFLAVLKTIFTNELQRPPHESRWGVGLPSTRLVQYLALYAVNQTVLVASWTGEIKGLTSNLAQGSPSPRLELGGGLLRISLPWPWLWLFNALAASMLNLASFDANKRCGPLSMAIAANMKQVVILVLLICFRDFTKVSGEETQETERRAEDIVILGSLITTIGGVWYAFASLGAKKVAETPVWWEKTRVLTKRGWKG
ncbi:hypothetical protein CLAIMM_06994 [Cladophialophora immunda]|nr:hypothetical protein CLAIMM_06994 [Cladophialophora immunda]